MTGGSESLWAEQADPMSQLRNNQTVNRAGGLSCSGVISYEITKTLGRQLLDQINAHTHTYTQTKTLKRI